MKTAMKISVLCVLIVLTSCSILTKSQIESINSYSGLLEKYSAYPSAIINNYVQIKYEIELLNTGTLDDTIVNSQLWSSYNGRKEAMLAASKIDLGMRVIGEYASALKKLSSKELSDSFGQGTKKVGTDIDQLIGLYNAKSEIKIPTGIGNLVKSSLTLLGSSYIKSQQAKNLKMYILEGQKFIPLLTDQMKNDLNNIVIIKWIPILKRDLKNRQQNFLRNMPKSDYKVYYANNFNKEVALLISRIDDLEQVSKKTVESVETVGKAHKQLLDNVQKRMKLEDILPEIQNFYVAVSEISTDYQSIIIK